MEIQPVTLQEAKMQMKKRKKEMREDGITDFTYGKWEEKEDVITVEVSVMGKTETWHFKKKTPSDE